MEPRDGAAPPLSEAPEPDAGERIRRRLRVVAVAVGLVALAFAQQPGLLIADTKLDLALAPGDLLRRSLSLWDAEGAFGQVQNQAYGYLWPMGPFFWAGDGLGLPEWVVQRSWIGFVMVVAFVGVVRLSRELGVTSQAASLLAGAAYALSPRMISLLGQISIEVWPGAVAPWVLLLLVRGSARGSPVAAAAGAALAVAMVGGVNAAATAAVLPLGVVWLLTRTPGPRRRALMLWWPVLTLLGTLWWLVPLFLLGAYSPPFLDYIETADVTTLATPLFDVVRGTSDWVAYVDPTWRAGNDLVSQGFWVVSGVVVLVLGLSGIVRRDQPHRRFLLAGLLVGVLMVGFGHTGAVQGWFAADQAQLLDGVLAPLRNVHKFDVVVRLVLVLGLAHAVDRAGRPGRRTTPGDTAPPQEAVTRSSSGARVGVLAVTLLAVVAAAGPAFLGRVAPEGAYLGVPEYWTQAADWLARQDDGSGSDRALLLPGSSFGTYSWGFTRDEPIQVLASSPWGVRNAVPLTPPGHVRMLDAVERRLSAGEGSPGLADHLRRAGVRYLLVRHDLQPGGRVPDPVLVEQALSGSPGLEPVVSFGPEVGGETRLDDRRGNGPRLVVNEGWQDRLPALRVWEVEDVAPAVASPALPVVVGGPESLLDLAEEGVVGSGPTVLAPDLPPDAEGAPLDGPLVLTDGLRRREVSFGAVHDNTSVTLAPGEERLGARPRTDYLVGPDEAAFERWRADARYEGAAFLAASSSASDADNAGPVLPGRSPYAALDGNPATQWVSGRDTGEAPWLEVGLGTAAAPDVVTVTLGDAVPGTSDVRVLTDAGSSDRITLEAGESGTLSIPPGTTERVRVEGTAGTPLALAAVDVPGVEVARVVDLPALPAAWGAPAAVTLGEGLGHRSACVAVGDDLRCAATRAREAEEPAGLRRTVDLGEDGEYDVRARVRTRGGPALVERLQEGLPLVAAASSSAVDEPGGSPIAAVDGDPGTTWVADPADEAPTLDLRWLGRQRVTALRVALDPDAPATRPREATVTWPGGEQTVRLDPSGRTDLEPFRASRATVELTAPRLSRSLAFDRSAVDVGVGVTEVRLRGTRRFPQAVPTGRERFGCGSGPTLAVDGEEVRTEVVARRSTLLRGATATARPCGDSRTLALPAGRTALTVLPSTLFAPAAVRLGRADLGGAPVDGPSPAPVDLATDGPDSRTAGAVEPGSTLVVRENANPGWEARPGTPGDGAPEPVVVDGWQQGWRLPEGGMTSLRFAPQTAYAVGLGTGAVSLLLLAVLTLLLARRRPRRDLPALAERRVPRLVGAAGLAAVVALAAGTPGLLVAAGAAVAHPVVRRVPDGPRALLVGAGIVVAGAVYWLRPLGSIEGWAGDSALPQLAVVVSLVWAGLEVLDPSRRRGDRPDRPQGGSTSRSRVAGPSTPR